MKISSRTIKSRSVKNIVAVIEGVAENPVVSIKRFSQQLLLTQKLKLEDHGHRRTFADWVLRDASR